MLLQTREKIQGPKQTDELIIFQKCLQLWVICLVKPQNALAFVYNYLFVMLFVKTLSVHRLYAQI